ncbi:M23 family metallopeptidase [Candidatus Woesearchaeota archaeon]|nr:M23 family metallopeptidase [Candidatus Woesearchaeota archaeon]
MSLGNGNNNKMARRERVKERTIKPRRELSDLIYGNWEALHYAIGSLIPATMYALGLKIMETPSPELSEGEAVAAGLAGSFALRYASIAVDFLIPEIQRESYIRKNQREIVQKVARTASAITAGTLLAYVTDAPFLYTTILSIASFMTGKTAAEKMPEMKYSTTIPAGMLLLGSCLHLSLTGVASTTTLIKENITEGKDEATRVEAEPQVEYTAKPPFRIWPAQYDTRLVNSCFGYRGEHVARGKGSKHHGGIDIQAPWHTPVLSVGNGVVIDVDAKRWGSVTIEHGDGITTQYLHMDEVLVKEGDQITAGTQIGLSGGKGPKGKTLSSLRHLHFCSPSYEIKKLVLS